MDKENRELAQSLCIPGGSCSPLPHPCYGPVSAPQFCIIPGPKSPQARAPYSHMTVGTSPRGPAGTGGVVASMLGKERDPRPPATNPPQPSCP